MMAYSILRIAVFILGGSLNFSQAKTIKQSLTDSPGRPSRPIDVKSVLSRTEAVEALLRRCVHRSVMTTAEDESITEVTRLAFSIGILSSAHLDSWVESLTARRRLLTSWYANPSAAPDCEPTKAQLDDLIEYLEMVELQLKKNETAAGQAEESAKHYATQMLSTRGDGLSSE